MGYTVNPLVDWLLTRSYGQGGTVATPSPNTVPVVGLGDFPAGVGDVLDRLVTKYITPAPPQRGDDIEWCFLVGGPGNGKSEALRYLASTLLARDRTALASVLQARGTGDPVPRAVPVDWPASATPLASGLEIVFINDASIPRSGARSSGEPGSLFLDLSDGIKRFVDKSIPVVMFGSVNRGILVEEIGGLDGIATPLDGNGEKAATMIRWLASPPTVMNSSPEYPSSLATVETLVAVDPIKPYYGQFRVPLRASGAEFNVIVHVVFLDVLSLLEPVPGSSLSRRAVDFSAAPPVVAGYEPLGGFSDVPGGATRDRTTAGKLLQAIVDQSRWEGGNCIDPASGTLCEAHATCPFAQNARWLQDTALCNRVLDFFRAGEIAAGRRMTYRDLVGHVSLALIGEPEEDWLTGMRPCQWVERKARGLLGGEKKVTAELVHHRIYMNLFPPPDTQSWKRAAADPLKGDNVYAAVIGGMTKGETSPRVPAFERAFNDLDPSRDTEPWEGVRARALDAVESLDVTAPSEKVPTWTEVSPQASSRIETIVDQAIREEIVTELGKGQKTASTRAKILRKWRSTLLLRQVGVALGRMSFEAAVRAWLAEQENSIQGGAPMDLGKGIKSLLLPPAVAGNFWIAPFRPRTYALTGVLPTNTVLIPIDLNDLRVDVVPRGDNLVAELVQAARGRYQALPEVLASLVIDLSVARESILHVQGISQSFTEIGDSAFARIERARAALASRARAISATVHFTGSSGALYRLTINPAGPTPLRVQKA